MKEFIFDIWNITFEPISFFSFTNCALKVSFSEGNSKISFFAHCSMGTESEESFLTVDYKEPSHSIGKFHHPKKDKNSDRETLISRWIDRFLRPLLEPFSKNLSVFIELLEISPFDKIKDLQHLASITSILLIRHLFPIKIGIFSNDSLHFTWNEKNEIISLSFESIAERKNITNAIKDLMQKHRSFFKVLETINSQDWKIEEDKTLLNSWEEIKNSSNDILKRKSAQMLIGSGRIDKRKNDEIRKISFHSIKSNSVLFTKEKTNVISTVDLSFEKFITGETFVKKDNLFVFYHFPFFATEEKNNRKKTRRELGHGELVKSTFKNQLIEDLTYRINCQTCSADGSSSMSSVCSTSGALWQMNLLENPVFGISVGNFDKKNPILDITALEDNYSNMDLKIAGYNSHLGKKICSIQMDTKEPISLGLISKALLLAEKTFKNIFQTMKKDLKKQNFWKFIYLVKEKVKFVIGSNGTTKKLISEATDSRIWIGETNQMLVYSKNMEILEEFINFYGQNHYIGMQVSFFYGENSKEDIINTTLGPVQLNKKIEKINIVSGKIINLNPLSVKINS